MTPEKQLFAAIRRDDERALASLVSRHGRRLLEARERPGFGPVAVAGAVRSLGALKALLRCGADPNERSRTRAGATALHSLVESGRAGGWSTEEARDAREAAGMLHAAGADLEATDTEGRTPLWHAVNLKHSEALAMLLAMGADANTRGCGGLPALAEAVRVRSLPVVERLLAAGADPNRWEHWSSSPLYVAAVNPGRGILETLLEHGARVTGTQCTHMVAVRGSRARLKLLLEHGGDVEERNQEGRTVLHSAALSYYAATRVPLVLAFGADPNAPDGVGATALHLAARTTPVPLDALDALVDAGGDLGREDASGRTPLGLLSQNRSGGREAAEYLQSIARQRRLTPAGAAALAQASEPDLSL